MRILLLADIHGNFPALEAIDNFFTGETFDLIVNCGDSVVYAPFPNEVLEWLQNNQAVSILGNTDKKVIKLLDGKSLKKPKKQEKRIMYTHTAEILKRECGDYLRSLPLSTEVVLVDSNPPYSRSQLLGVFHGSPAHPHEHLFDSTPKSRFLELAEEFPYWAIVTGHSHTPYHLVCNSSHFINPGSVGRMFDGTPAASCAVLTVHKNTLDVRHHRIDYEIARVTDALHHYQLPPIYQLMYTLGKKLN